MKLNCHCTHGEQRQVLWDKQGKASYFLDQAGGPGADDGPAGGLDGGRELELYRFSGALQRNSGWGPLQRWHLCVKQQVSPTGTPPGCR